ncbi:MAG: nuclear transport factor 2 family protein, partial [Pseudomonadota bacterium]
TIRLACAAAVGFAVMPLTSLAQEAGQPPGPMTSRDQEQIYRHTIPTDFTTEIFVADEEGAARAQQILDLYEILATDPTIEAVSQFVSPDYIQHSSMIPDGPEPLAMLFSISVAQYPVAIDVHRIAVVGDFGMAHVNFRNLDTDDPNDLGIAAVDMYRWNDEGMIVEHWDVLQDVPVYSANTNGMFLPLYDGGE